jgi:hypothetical protein
MKFPGNKKPRTELWYGDSRLTVSGLLGITFATGLGLAIVAQDPSLGIFLLTLFWGIFFGRLGTRQGRASFAIRTVVSTLAIVGALALAWYTGETVFADPQYRIPPAAHFLGGILVFVVGFCLIAICKYSLTELVVALIFLQILVPIFVFASIESRQSFWWSYFTLINWELGIVVALFMLAIILGGFSKSYLRQAKEKRE